MRFLTENLCILSPVGIQNQFFGALPRKIKANTFPLTWCEALSSIFLLWAALREQIEGSPIRWCEALFCEIESEAALRDEISNSSKSYDSRGEIALNVR